MPIPKPIGQWLDPGYVEVFVANVSPILVSGTLKNYEYPLTTAAFVVPVSPVYLRNIPTFNRDQGLATIYVSGTLIDETEETGLSWNNISETAYNALSETEYYSLPEFSGEYSWNNISESEYNGLNETQYNSLLE